MTPELRALVEGLDPRVVAALEAAKGLTATPKTVERLTHAHGVELARWSLSQWELRGRASAKFTRADQMLFEREALEQATHERVATYHASQFPHGAFVADLSCGIGGDLKALAERGPSRGYELDPERAALARFNTAQEDGEVILGDSLQAEWDFEFALADPARRSGGARLQNPEEFAPNPSVLAKRMSNLRLGVLKLTPFLEDRYLLALGARIEFVSFGGECREALVFVGREAPTPGVYAVQIPNAPPTGTDEAGPVWVARTDYPAEVTQPDAYLFDADPAAVRAHALGAFGMPVLGGSHGYLTGPTPLASPWLRTYKVLASHPADAKRTREALASLGARLGDIKIRGVKIAVPELRRELTKGAAGGESVVDLAIWPIGKRVQHTLVQRVASD